jgi:hypothetical protein
MGITSSAGDGVRVSSAAYNEASAGSQAQANGIDGIVFANNISAVNNGNLAGSPTFSGRLAIIRQGTISEETRYVLSQVAGTGSTIIGTVHEPWITAPASTDTIHVCYIVQDTATLTGFSLINKRTDDYSMSRVFRIGTSGGGAFAFFALLNGASIETSGPSSTTVGNIIVELNARFDIGYIASGNPVSGGAIYGAGGAGTADGNILLDTKSTSEINFYDSYFKSVNNYKMVINGSATINRLKLYKCLYQCDLTGLVDLQDSSFEGTRNVNETILIDSTTDVSSISLVNNNGLLSRNDAVVEDIVVYNAKFTGNVRYITTYNQKTWKIINPLWDVDTATQNNIYFSGSTNTRVNEYFGIETTVATPAGTPLSGSAVYFYESLTNDLISVSGSTNSSGYIYEDLQLFQYTSGSGGTLNSAATGNYYSKAYYYGKKPFIGAVEKVAAANTVSFVALVEDTQLTAASSATALTNGAGITVEKFDVNPIKVMAYDGGTGTVPTVGETISAGTASGILVEYIGDEISGYLVLEWNGVAFADNAALSGSTSSFAALTDTVSFYQEYTWLIDCNNLSLGATYDYINAKLTQLPADFIYSKLVEWGGVNYAGFLFAENSSFYTLANAGVGVWAANYASGTLQYLTSDSGTQFIPPTSYTLTLTEIEPGSQVVIMKNYLTTPEEIFYVASVAGSGIAAYSYIYSGDITATILISSLTLENSYIELTLSNSNQTLPVAQNVDRIYRNPT